MRVARSGTAPPSRPGSSGTQLGQSIDDAVARIMVVIDVHQSADLHRDAGRASLRFDDGLYGLNNHRPANATMP
jgi:hypothetical protein